MPECPPRAPCLLCLMRRPSASGRPRVARGLSALALVLLALLLIPRSPIRAFTISSAAMAPTLLPQDSVLVNRLAYLFRTPRRGDVIVFRYPRLRGREFVKRVIAVPGDVVAGRGGRLSVNGKLEAEIGGAPVGPGIQGSLRLPPQRIPPGQLFVLGDNAEASLDSRYWGDVNLQDVVGAAVLVCWSHGRNWWDVRWNRLGRWLSSHRPAQDLR